MITVLKPLNDKQHYEKPSIQIVGMDVLTICDKSGGSVPGRQDPKPGTPGTRSAKSFNFEDASSVAPSASWDDSQEATNTEE